MPNIIITPSLPSVPGLPPALRPLSGLGLPNNPVVIEYDELSSLLPMVLSDGQTNLSFPTIYLKESLSKDLAIHKYPNLDGARVENMGSNPEVWQIKAIFTNHIDPDPVRGETWQRGTLFPQVFLQVLDMLKTAGNKIIQHPLYGNRNVQIVSFDYEIVAIGPRDGAYLTLNLIRTIADSRTEPLIPVSVITAGNTISRAMQDTGPDFPPPPGLSLNQFFSQMSSFVGNIVNYPSNVVAAVQDFTLQLSAITSFATLSQPTLASSFVVANGGSTAANLAYNNSNQQSTIVANKRAPLGSPFNPFPVNNGNIKNISTSSVQPLFATSFAAQKAIKSLTSLNNNPSKNASTFIDKCTTSTVDTMNYYIGMNRSEVSNIIYSLAQMIFALQNAKSQLATNTQLRNVVVKSYLTLGNNSWPQLSSLLNNSLDDLFSLNTIPNVNYLYVPNNTVVSYYQSNAS